MAGSRLIVSPFAAAVLLIAFLAVEARMREPLLPLDPFKSDGGAVRGAARSGALGRRRHSTMQSALCHEQEALPAVLSEVRKVV